jgi:ribulose-phosphate 3-epimerase
MDGHFVPNITFGPGIIKRLRKIGKQPFDAHLMISEPSRYMDQFIDAGCDSITFHVEVEEPIEPTLLKIRKAGRLAGLAIKPATPLSALDPYRDLLDIVMVMTVEPGFGGQKFMADAAAKIDPAHEVFRDRRARGRRRARSTSTAASTATRPSTAAPSESISSSSARRCGRRARTSSARSADQGLADEGYRQGAGSGSNAGKNPARDRTRRG